MNTGIIISEISRILEAQGIWVKDFRFETDQDPMSDNQIRILIKGDYTCQTKDSYSVNTEDKR